MRSTTQLLSSVTAQQIDLNDFASNDGYLLPGLPAAVQAHCNGLPAAAPNSVRPLVNKFHNVS